MSRKAKRILKRKTSSKKLNASVKRMSEWIKFNRHKLSMPLLIAELNQKLRGHYAYYGMTFNTRRLNSYYYQTKRLLHNWPGQGISVHFGLFKMVLGLDKRKLAKKFSSFIELPDRKKPEKILTDFLWLSKLSCVRFPN